MAEASVFCLTRIDSADYYLRNYSIFSNLTDFGENPPLLDEANEKFDQPRPCSTAEPAAGRSDIVDLWLLLRKNRLWMSD